MPTKIHGRHFVPPRSPTNWAGSAILRGGASISVSTKQNAAARITMPGAGAITAVAGGTGAAWPSPATTGVQSGVTLTAQNSDINTSVNNQVIQNLDFLNDTAVIVRNTNVTIINCRFNGGGFAGSGGIRFLTGADGSSATHCELSNCGIGILPEPDQGQAGPSNITVAFCYIHGSCAAGNGMFVQGNFFTYHDNYMENITGAPGDHIDGIQGPDVGVDNWTLTHNYFNMGLGITSSCVTFGNNGAGSHAPQNVAFNNNWFHNGSNNVYCEGDTPSPSGFFNNCKWGGDGGFIAFFPPGNHGTLTQSGNVDEAGNPINLW